MPCLVVVLTLAFPRAVLIGMWIFTNMLSRAFDGLVLPILGFLFLPITTIVYTWMVNVHRPIEGVNLLIVIVAVVLDVGSNGSGVVKKRWE